MIDYNCSFRVTSSQFFSVKKKNYIYIYIYTYNLYNELRYGGAVSVAVNWESHDTWLLVRYLEKKRKNKASFYMIHFDGGNWTNNCRPWILLCLSTR